jgi:hypothetical protein
LRYGKAGILLRTNNITGRPHYVQGPGRSPEPTALPGKFPESSMDAGNRVLRTYELLELCLLNLPNKDILLSQLVNKVFESVIKTSLQLQRKLFFKIDPAAGVGSETRLNPIFAHDTLRIAVPLFFDHKEKRLTCYYGDGRTRLYCRSMRATKVLVHMDLSSEEPIGDPGLTRGKVAHQRRILEQGSWKRMYLSQPICSISWRVQFTQPTELGCKGSYISSREITYNGCYGTPQGECTFGALLRGLEYSSVIEGK